MDAAHADHGLCLHSVRVVAMTFVYNVLVAKKNLYCPNSRSTIPMVQLETSHKLTLLNMLFN